MTRRRWILLAVLAFAAVVAAAALFDDGSTNWRPEPGPGLGRGAPPPRPAREDEDAAGAARAQFVRVFAHCGEIYRAQRTEMQPISGGSGGGLARAVTVSWEYRGVSFEPRPQPLREVDGFNNVTWRGDVRVSYGAQRRSRPGADALWQTGEPLVLPMQKRNGHWDPSGPLVELEKERWRGRC